MRISLPRYVNYSLIALLAACPSGLFATCAFVDESPAGQQETAKSSVVDYSALEQESRAVMAQVQAALQAHLASGKKEQFKADPKILDPIRKKAEEATGELREALMIQEFALSAMSGGASSFKERILKEVKPSSMAWKVAPDMVPYLGQMIGKEAEPYLEAMRKEGAPGARAAIFAADSMRLMYEKNDPEGAKAVMARAQSLAPDSQSVKASAMMLDGELKTAVGRQAPDFRVPDIEKPGHFHTLADFKGSYLLVDFWGTWCGWCVKELPTTHKVYEKFKDKGLKILSVAKEAKGETVMAFREKPGFPMPWKHGLLLDTKEHPDPMVAVYGVSGFPSLFLIGPDGKLLAKGGSLREGELEKTLNQFLKP